MCTASRAAGGAGAAIRVCATAPAATGGATGALVDTLLVATARDARFVTWLGDRAD